MQIEYINREGSLKCQEQNHKKNTNLCSSCRHLKKFYSIPSFKTVQRCTKYGSVSTRCQFKTCKYYNSKPKFELIIGV